MRNPWYGNAIIYSLDVETFQDSNADGIGDFPGLTAKLDYFSDLGITCLWLQPFYPTPNHDDGYDVSDYYGIDPRLGTLSDFRRFIVEADRRRIRVLVDLVANHTSTHHPWFQEARQRTSKYRDYYIWLDDPPELERRGGLVFPGEQSSNWAYDQLSNSYYWHWFYKEQPDLNTGNPEVRAEIKKVIGYWLDLGVSGFRLDAAPFLFKRKGVRGSYPDDPHGFLVELREFLNEKRPDAIFLAEADVAIEELTFFLGEGERMHLLFNFILNNYLFLALARRKAEPLARAFARLPPIPSMCQWANFVRNHDELNLDRLEADERNEVFDSFAPDTEMRIYGRGIRRRLPPMLKANRRWLELVYSLLFALPGIPVLRYGQEIGMGEDLSLPGRLSVRTPMQWSAGLNGGFSDGPPEVLVRPMVSDGDFSFHQVNVEDQQSDPDSLLSFFRRLIQVRTALGFCGRRCEVLHASESHVFAHAFHASEENLFCLHNLSGEKAFVTLAGEFGCIGQVQDVWSDGPYDSLENIGERIELNGFGYRWLRHRAA